MKNFKITLLFFLGTVLIFVFVMFLYHGGPRSMKTNVLRVEFDKIYKSMMINFASKGYYFNSVKDLQEFSDFKTGYYSIFLTPDEYLLCDDTKIEQVPAEYRSMAFVDYTRFLVVAIQCVDKDDNPAVFTLDEKNNIVQIAGE
jgi:hypothetical protein